MYPLPPFMVPSSDAGGAPQGPGQVLPRSLPPVQFRQVDLDAESPEIDEDEPINVDDEGEL